MSEMRMGIAGSRAVPEACWLFLSGNPLPVPCEAYFSGSKSREAEFMQYLSPVGFGPSVNTWPR